MKQSIVFDLDGTLITCENKQKYVLHSILNCLGYVDRDYLRYWWMYKRNGHTTETALIHIGISNAHQISVEWKQKIEDFTWTYFDAPFQDSNHTLEFLKENIYCNIILLTARKSSFQVMQAIQRFGFNKYIDDVIVVEPGKVVEAKAEFLKKIKPIVYIGDTELDYKASMNSKSQFVAVSRGQRSVGFLKKAGIARVEKDLSFLKDIRFMSDKYPYLQ